LWCAGTAAARIPVGVAVRLLEVAAAERSDRNADVSALLADLDLTDAIAAVVGDRVRRLPAAQGSGQAEPCG